MASSLREVLSEVKATGVGDNKNVLAEVNVETVRHLEIQVVGNVIGVSPWVVAIARCR